MEIISLCFLSFTLGFIIGWTSKDAKKDELNEKIKTKDYQIKKLQNEIRIQKHR
jgi:hypothetical protein